MKRATFLSRIAEAAARGRNHRVRKSAEISQPPSDQPADRCKQLQHELTLVEIETVVVESTEQAVEQAEKWMRELKAKLVDVSDESLPALEKYQAMASTLGARQIETVEESLAADVGVTGVDWAIANCGTLVLNGGKVRSRLTPIGPANHIAVVYERQILHDLGDLAEIWQSQFTSCANTIELPANVLLITGPSKTGDIEMKLTRGVHGPGSVFVVIVRE